MLFSIHNTFSVPAYSTCTFFIMVKEISGYVG